MNENLLLELEEAIREMGQHLRGEIDLPPEQIHFVGEPDPRAVRATLGLTQPAFAALLGVPVATLRNWEQGRRRPHGSAMQLLRIAEKHPDVFADLTPVG